MKIIAGFLTALLGAILTLFICVYATEVTAGDPRPSAYLRTIFARRGVCEGTYLGLAIVAAGVILIPFKDSHPWATVQLAISAGIVVLAFVAISVF